MHSNNHYNKNLKDFARELRTLTVSKAEKHIWKAVLSRKQTDERVLRQRPIDNFIVDFFCAGPRSNNRNRWFISFQ